MRLIDADELKKIIDKKEKWILELIDEQPTAYNVDAVVEQLEERAEEHRKLAFSMDGKKFCAIADKLYGKQVECLEIIEIVRKGGVQ